LEIETAGVLGADIRRIEHANGVYLIRRQTHARISDRGRCEASVNHGGGVSIRAAFRLRA